MLRSIVFLLLCSSISLADQPAEAILAANKDLQTLIPAERGYTRYLWVMPDDVKIMRMVYQVNAGHLNFLSTRQRVIAPVGILQDGTSFRWPRIPEKLDWSKLQLIRIRGIDYGDNFLKVWEQLGNPALEPLFHDFQKGEYYPAGKYNDGTPYAAGYLKQIVLAPWLTEPLGLPEQEPARGAAKKEYLDALVSLKEQTYSSCPVIEASNFIWQTAIQFDRKAGYYDFLGVKDLASFQKLVGFNEKDSLAFADPLLEVVPKSGVTTEARRVEIWKKINGRYIFTKDQINRGQGNQNPINVIERDALKFKAIEVFANKSNGLWTTGLFNDVGVRQDSAPDGIGYFHQSVTNDGKIHINLSCLACHDNVAGNGGIQPFKPYFRSLYSTLALGSPQLKVLRGLEDAYLTPIDLKGDQQQYIESLFQANGMLPNEYARGLLEIFTRWERPVDMGRAAVLYGVTEKELKRAMDDYLTKLGALDNVNANWTLPEETRAKFTINSFSENYRLGQLALRGLPFWSVDSIPKTGGKK